MDPHLQRRQDVVEHSTALAIVNTDVAHVRVTMQRRPGYAKSQDGAACAAVVPSPNCNVDLVIALRRPPQLHRETKRMYIVTASAPNLEHELVEHYAAVAAMAPVCK